MNTLEAISNRYSVRNYLDHPVEEDKLERVLEAARLAPSASNRQEWRFIVVTDPETRARLSEAAAGEDDPRLPSPICYPGPEFKLMVFIEDGLRFPCRLCPLLNFGLHLLNPGIDQVPGWD